MSYEYEVSEVSIFVPAAKVPHMLQSLQSVAKAAIVSDLQSQIKINDLILSDGRSYASSYVAYLRSGSAHDQDVLDGLHGRELAPPEILAALDWKYEFDGTGNLISMWHQDGSDLHEDEIESVMPFADLGSYIQVQGDRADDVFRFVFRSGQVAKVRATVTFEED